jgi:hypothetical protein
LRPFSGCAFAHDRVASAGRVDATLSESHVQISQTCIQIVGCILNLLNCLLDGLIIMLGEKPVSLRLLLFQGALPLGTPTADCEAI